MGMIKGGRAVADVVELRRSGVISGLFNQSGPA
jgi:hypothetical protein